MVDSPIKAFDSTDRFKSPTPNSVLRLLASKAKILVHSLSEVEHNILWKGWVSNAKKLHGRNLYVPLAPPHCSPGGWISLIWPTDFPIWIVQQLDIVSRQSSRDLTTVLFSYILPALHYITWYFILPRFCNDAEIRKFNTALYVLLINQ